MKFLLCIPLFSVDNVSIGNIPLHATSVAVLFVHTEVKLPLLHIHVKRGVLSETSKVHTGHPFPLQSSNPPNEMLGEEETRPCVVCATTAEGGCTSEGKLVNISSYNPVSTN